LGVLLALIINATPIAIITNPAIEVAHRILSTAGRAAVAAYSLSLNALLILCFFNEFENFHASRKFTKINFIKRLAIL